MVTMKLKDCCTIIAGQSPESKYYNTEGVGIPFFQGKADFGEVYPTIRVYCSQPTKIAEKDDILLSVRAPVGPTNLSPGTVCIGRGLTAIRPSEILNLKYLLHYFRYFEAQLQQKGTGTTFKAITQDVIKNLEVPIPPLDEQERIVSRIEELFSELDNGVETLRKIKQQLAVYRQAVLKKAFEGKLTSCVSMREVALKNLVYGKDGLRRGPFGSAIKKSFFVPDGFKVYEQGNAINDDPYRGRYYITQEKYEELKNFHIKPHDLLVSCSGVTLGRSVELPDDAKPGVINQALLRIRLNHEMIATRYFIEFFRSEMFQRKIFDKSQGSAMPNLVGITEFKEITLNVPHSLDDQLAIVSEIENRVSVCDNIEKTVDTALQQAEAMRQSILKQAFKGRV